LKSAVFSAYYREDTRKWEYASSGSFLHLLPANLKNPGHGDSIILVTSVGTADCYG